MGLLKLLVDVLSTDLVSKGFFLLPMLMYSAPVPPEVLLSSIAYEACMNWSFGSGWVTGESTPTPEEV